MKKLSILFLSALCLGFTSCEEEWVDATPQANPQENVMSAEGLTLTDALPEAISLTDIKEANAAIPVLEIAEVKDLPMNSELKFVMELSNTADFTKVAQVETTVAETAVTVTPDDWQAAHLAVIGRSPKQKEAFIRFAAYVVKGTSVARLGDPTLFYGSRSVKVTPYPSELVIEENYYLLGTINGWDVATALKFDHSGDPYDNPVFTIKVDVSEDDATNGWWWKIVPESTFITGGWVDAPNAAYGVAENGSEDLSGMLIAKTATVDPGAGCLKTAGQLLLTINLEDGTYEYTSAVDNLYTPGNSNGWSQTASQMLRTSNYADYEGFAHLNGSFKFTNAPDWNHTNYGLGGGEGVLSTDPSAGNLEAAADGLYYCQVNTSALTYTITLVQTMGLIGDATAGGWNDSTPLTPSADFLTWTGTVDLGAGEFKFRANNGWDINLGGSLTDLTQGGNNIATPGAGKYVVTLNLSTLPYTATVVAAN